MTFFLNKTPVLENLYTLFSIQVHLLNKKVFYT